ncbi:MAG: toxic anion resistance protein [Lachnospiraceae bacterium]|nr:toxic anion resistance protein [Lachnospiraceae bacterium]
MNEELKELNASIPTLTFGDALAEAKPAEAAAEPQKEESTLQINLDDSVLTEEEKKAVEQFTSSIDLRNTQGILEYGAGVQKKMADFSQETLDQVRTKDLGEIGSLLTSVVAEVKGFDDSTEQKGILGLFKKGKNKVESMKASYDKTEANITKICDSLEGHQITLLKDVATLDKMYDLNMASFKEITMYILAGSKKLEEVRNGELRELQEKAQASGKTEDAQAAQDLAEQCNRFEKKLYDLDLTRTISLQTAPQIRLLQNTDTQMAEKIQSVIVNTIPLWKNQMVIALGIAHSTEAIEAENAVTNATNELLKKNAENLHQASVTAAKANERGIVDLETLKHTNQQLINTLDDVMKIQKEGRAARQNAEQELRRMEDELKGKLIEMSRR